jgi:hypothetical protein
VTSRSARIEVGRLLRKLAGKIEPRGGYECPVKVRFVNVQDDNELSWP